MDGFRIKVFLEPSLIQVQELVYIFIHSLQTETIFNSLGRDRVDFFEAKIAPRKSKKMKIGNMTNEKQ